jgi:transcriptional regulator with XRE-family HTH domain
MEESRIKFIRQMKGGISQAKLASLLGVPAYKIKYAEIGNDKISSELAYLLEEKLGVNLKWVLTGAPPMMKNGEVALQETGVHYEVSSIHVPLTVEENKLLDALRVFPDVREAMEAFLQLPPRKQKIYLGKLLEEVEKLRDEGIIPPCMTT